MRLIDADNLIPMIRYATIDSEVGIFPILIGFDAIKKVVDEAPTIDAEPVKHGKWIYCRDRYADHKQYQCSVCGKHMWSKEKYIKDEKYCFNCGSKMDLDEVNE